MENTTDLEKYKAFYDKQKGNWRKNSKKYYDKIMRLPDETTLEEVQKQKHFIEKRSEYQKKYYEKNKEMICERQRLYRLKIKCKNCDNKNI